MKLKTAYLSESMCKWRHHLHAWPETAFEEYDTAAFVASELAAMGLPVVTGLAGTGVLATLQAGSGQRAIVLRAELDALDLQESTELSYASRNNNKMHACGHDGHMSMLLGAAACLSENPSFNGTVHFLFQPAEEAEGGARVMVEEGFFNNYRVDEMYAMHNWPGLDAGMLAIRSGPVMAAFDTFEIKIEGKGIHAAMPHLGVDPIPIAAQLVLALQQISSRQVDPRKAVVVSVTSMHAGQTFNIIPQSVTLQGTVRSFESSVQEQVQDSMHKILQGLEVMFEVQIYMDYQKRYPATCNTEREADFARQVAVNLLGEQNVCSDFPASMGAEDFSFFLQQKPGCYLSIGNGDSSGGCLLHNPAYDFNDSILVQGSSYWVALVEESLNLKSSVDRYG